MDTCPSPEVLTSVLVVSETAKSMLFSFFVMFVLGALVAPPVPPVRCVFVLSFFYFLTYPFVSFPSFRDYETSEGTVQFRANICGELVGDYDCPAGTAFAAIAGDKCNPIGSLPFGDASLYAGTNDQSGIEIDMGIGAKTGACQNGFSGKIRVICDPTATTATFARVESTNSCNYVAIINSKSGCAKKKTSSSSGLSGGWIFTIL